MKILLTGGTGQLGVDLLPRLRLLGEVAAPERRELDLSHPEQVRLAVRSFRPDVVVNAAAYTAVERAQREPELAEAINGHAPGLLAQEARRLGALFLHYSTDYVFDGTKPSPYIEDDPPNPLNVYGRTKLQGERAVREAGGHWVVLRTSWLYSARGRNFVLAVLEKAQRGEALSVVEDQRGAPTWCGMLAEATVAIIRRTVSDGAESGLYHLAAAGSTSWYEFAKAVVRGAGLDAHVTPIRAADYGGVPRPANSLLNSDRAAGAFGVRMADWSAGLHSCLNELRR